MQEEMKHGPRWSLWCALALTLSLTAGCQNPGTGNAGAAGTSTELATAAASDEGGAMRPVGIGPASNRLPEAIQAAEAAGIPLTVAAGYAVPQGENARPILERSIVALRAVAETDRKAGTAKAIAEAISRPNLTAESTDFATVKRAVEARREALAPLRELKDSQVLLWPSDWEQAVLDPYSDLARVRELGQWLSASARVSGIEGNLEGALADLKTIQRLARLVARSGNAQHFATGMGVSAIGFAAATDVMNARPESATQMPALDLDMSAQDLIPVLRREVLAIVTFLRNQEHWERTAANRKPEDLRLDGPPATEEGRAKLTAWLEAWTPILRQANGRQPDFGRLEHDLIKTAAEAEKDQRPEAALNRELFSAYPELFDLLRTAVANQVLLQELAKVVSFQRTNGRFPARLSDLGNPALDPFTGAPLKYRVRENGVILFSVGRDGQDDGGRTSRQAEAEGLNRWDIVIGHPRRP